MTEPKILETDPQTGLLTDEEMGNALLGIASCEDTTPAMRLLIHRHASSRIAQAQHQITREATLAEVREKVKALLKALGVEP